MWAEDPVLRAWGRQTADTVTVDCEPRPYFLSTNFTPTLGGPDFLLENSPNL